ncbi:permease-like cell division protein FtsX [Homoserinibacter sp. YIM 151385]|uniref:permease-like cell division protein FtsX n=1 Tax=Homoserinibacter sp. YIM 151385 TaxID=2985506 RepID=UPI0022F0E729|nr:permease-like cell division protein FtsX [Homoserinibacter sp. YIM 151385]WBU38210.1 permease-like cell division protein FtsX [Homoserinibacter sp. YIM 151385]
MNLGLIFSEVGQGLRRNLSMVISVVLVTFISLTFVGAAILMQMQVGQMKGYWYDRAQVAVYLCTDISSSPNCEGQNATEEQIATVRQQLESPTLEPYVDRVEFEDHQQAYENFMDQFEGSAVTELVTPDILPEAYWVNLKDANRSEVIIDSLTGSPGVEEVVDQREYLQPIFDILNAASYSAIGIAALMLVAAVLLIATTIRLSAFSRRRELGIMRLVGASNRFIETPFVIEGVVAALVGSLLAGGAVVALVRFFVQGYLADTLADTAFIGLRDALVVVPILLGLGALLAAMASSFAIRRYLKV